jgi:hypothetical protein
LRNLIDRAKIPEWIIFSKFHSLHLYSIAPTYFLGVESFIHNLLLDGSKMKTRTKETGMLCFTILALANLELVNQILWLVPQKAEILIIPTTFAKTLDEPLIGKSINNGILQRLDFVIRATMCDELDT